MSQNKFINLEELSKTTQALLIKINEQSNLKVNKSSVSANFDTGVKIGSINGIDFYTPSINADSLSSIVAPVALSNDYWDLDSKPTSLSSFTNDVGYITSYTETDPTVPAWAKTSQKPTYTAAEVGALPDSTVIPEDKVFIATYNSTTFADTVTAYNAGKLIFAVYTGDSANGKLILPLTRYIGTFFQFEGKYLNGRSAQITLYLRSSGGWSAESKLGDIITRNATISSGDSFIIRDSDSNGVMKYSSLIFGSSTDQYLANDGTWQSLNKIQTTAGDNNIEFDLIGTAPTNTNNEVVSVYKPTLITFAKTNEFGRLTLGSSTIPGVIRLHSSTTNATGYTDLKGGSSSTNTRTITFPDADGIVALTNDIPNVPSWALATNKPTYTASEVGAVTTSDVSSMINSAVSGITSFSTEIVQTLPATGVTGRFYFVPSNIGTNNIYEEYIYVNNTWEKLGNFDASSIDLGGYVPKYSDNGGTQGTDWSGTMITNQDEAISLYYLDDATSAYMGLVLQSDGLSIRGSTGMSVTLKNLVAPTENTDAATKQYVDTVAANAGVTSFNGSTGAITYIPPVSSVNGQTGVVELTIPADTSELTNGAGFLTSFTETDPTVPSWAKASTKPSYTASEVGAMATTHAANSITSSDISNWNGKTSNTGTVTSVRVQATSPVQSSTSTAQSTTLNTTISLASGYGDTQNPYASKTKNYVLAAPSNANGVPSFRALVASDLPAIGNITNGGDITANATIASGDRLIINDESASKVINSSITFGSSTKQYLANNGTWQNAYDDTALAARVSALEQLEWATYYSGRTNPSNSQGQNGDIYLQY